MTTSAGRVVFSVAASGTRTVAVKKPSALDHRSDSVPVELRDQSCWLTWRWERRDDEWTKPPYSARTGEAGSSTDPATWSTYAEARDALRTGRYDGIGYALQADSGQAGVDLDDCVDPETGKVDAWARAIVKRVDSYTEFSPSGRGLRIFLKAALPGRGHNKKLHKIDPERYPRPKAGIEAYDRGRYLTVTGHHLAGTPRELTTRQDAFLAIHDDFWPARATPDHARRTAQPVELSDAALLEVAFNARNGAAIHALWDGDLGAHSGDHSGADLALMNHLTFYTNGDAARMEYMFSRSGLGQRQKWQDRPDYRTLTIDKALDGWNGEGYTAPSERLMPSSNGTYGANDVAQELSSLSTLSSQESSWPDSLDGEALYGLAGDFVGGVVPYSEACEPALLAHFLTAAAALIGPTVHAEAGDAIHPARLNVMLVGESAKGRKGSSWQPTRRLLDMAQAGFTAGCVVEGLASGEGLIWQVRDRITKTESVGKGPDRHREEVEVDPGVSDKRLLVVESELATTLRVMQREGNTLSAVIRRAWDSGMLRTLTKNTPAKATGAHICIAGHVTREELLRYLDRSELANGFANRFLVFASKRGRVLPDGESTPDGVLGPLATSLSQVSTWASRPRRLRRDPDASAIWHDIYADLSEGRPGLVGCVTNRAEAQVLRLSVLYAALDCSEAIRAEHLLAALAVWKYADSSARWVFGRATGNPDADVVLSLIRGESGEMKREAIVKALSGHVYGRRLDRALSVLEGAGLLLRVKAPSTGGRPPEVWRVA